MQIQKRAVCVFLLLAVLLAGSFSLIPTASAEESWQSLYRTHLSANRSGVAKRTLGLCDLDGNGTPELLKMDVGAKRTGSFSILYISGGKVAQKKLSLLGIVTDSAAFKGVQSVSFAARADAEKRTSLLLTIQSKADGCLNTYTYAFSAASTGTLQSDFTGYRQARAGKTRYYLGTERVSASEFRTQQRQYTQQYSRKLGGIHQVSLKGSASAGAYKNALNKLSKYYAQFSTARKVTLSKSKLSLEAGSSALLSAKVAPTSALYDAISWTSSEPGVATVDDAGKVTAVSAGTTSITARTASGKSKSCKVTVTQPQPTSVSLADATLLVGATAQLTPEVTPANARRSFTWKSSDASIAAVNSDGVVSGKKEGTAEITVKTPNGKSASCTVVVTEKKQTGYILDISQYNIVTDWSTLEKSVDFLILRATCGTVKDTKFETYAAACNARGIPFGVYCYGKAYNVEDAQAEADMLYSVAEKYHPNFYVYDAETTQLSKTIIEAFFARLEKKGVQKTGCYIAHHLYNTYKIDTSKVDFIWIPHYGSNTGAVSATPDYKCDIHQFTSKGRVDGIAGNVDMNRLMDGGKPLSFYLKR